MTRSGPPRPERCGGVIHPSVITCAECHVSPGPWVTSITWQISDKMYRRKCLGIACFQSQVLDILSKGELLRRYTFFFLWRISPNLGLGLPPWNSPFQFGLLDLRHSVGLLGWVISSSQGLYLNTNTEKRTHIHKHQTSMPWVEFEPTIAASERAKTVYALDRPATVTSATLFTHQ
jgi:hypothetical protein